MKGWKEKHFEVTLIFCYVPKTDTEAQAAVMGHLVFFPALSGWLAPFCKVF